ncbi:MAG: F0F1 ATP synthase subunit delta [Planctomycetaceae bacterium]|nr:F0F1 ATP synthase subunit delta [Planctomycetaceae bacterium]
MRIDWFTFGAQIVNFLILVWLLKRFLYGPIITAMDQREKAFRDREKELAEAKLAADREAEEYRQKQQKMEHAREEQIAAAAREIDEWKREQTQLAREEIDQLRANWFRGIQLERASFIRELQQRTAHQIYRTTRQVLKELCDVSLEQQIITSFLERLDRISEVKRQQMAQSIRNDSEPILIESSMELTKETQDQIRSQISSFFAEAEARFDFQVVPALIGGIELQAAGHKIAWSLRETLEMLEEEFTRSLENAIPHDLQGNFEEVGRTT